MTVNKWWKHTLPACTSGCRYTEVLLIDGLGTKPERKRMAKACFTCSDYLDCLEDVIAEGNAWEFHQVLVENDQTPSRPTPLLNAGDAFPDRR